MTYYFKAVAQFLATHSLSKDSEEKYQNTLWQFFDYYISKGNKYTIYGAREYAPLEEIKDRDFIEFLKNFKSTTRKASGKVPLAKCSHIFTMYDVMEKNGFSNVSTGYAVIDLTPDNPKYTARMSENMINAERYSKLKIMKK